MRATKHRVLKTYIYEDCIHAVLIEDSTLVWELHKQFPTRFGISGTAVLPLTPSEFRRYHKALKRLSASLDLAGIAIEPPDILKLHFVKLHKSGTKSTYYIKVGSIQSLDPHSVRINRDLTLRRLTKSVEASA